jgi:hypothetical protein
MLSGLTEWLTGLPTAAAAVVALSAGAMVSACGLLVVHPILPHRIRISHNDVSGFVLGIVGVIYAVLLAFIAVAVWENFGRTEQLVQTEANLVGNLYRDTAAFEDPAASKLRNLLFVYAETVVQDEWPALAAGLPEEESGWQLLDNFHTELLRLRTQDVGVALMQADMVQNLNALYDARRGRFHAAAEAMPSILWWNLIAGAVILMLFTYLFGVPRLPMHLSMVSLLGALIGLVLLLIVLLDNPFRGRSHVSVEPFNRLVRSVEARAYPHN